MFYFTIKDAQDDLSNVDKVSVVINPPQAIAANVTIAQNGLAVLDSGFGKEIWKRLKSRYSLTHDRSRRLLHCWQVRQNQITSCKGTTPKKVTNVTPSRD
jgi:hypothetical protein